MKEQRIFEALDLIDERYIEEATPFPKTRKTINWWKGLGAAACLCLVIALSIFVPNKFTNDSASCDESGVPPLVYNGTTYIISSVANNYYNSCPEGFSHAGQIKEGVYTGVDYYTNPEHPELLYLHVATYKYNANKDSLSPSAKMIMKEKRYVRFVDEQVLGDDLCP